MASGIHVDVKEIEEIVKELEEIEKEIAETAIAGFQILQNRPFYMEGLVKKEIEKITESSTIVTGTASPEDNYFGKLIDMALYYGLVRDYSQTCLDSFLEVEETFSEQFERDKG